jgi:hypothetical protein
MANNQHMAASEDRTDEVLIFKQHESDSRAVSRATPHSSFQIPGSEGLPTRESIEVRAFVRYD